jgi:hypothetical protein
MEEKELQWDDETFIPLQPNMDYQIIVLYPYVGKARGVVKFVVKLQPDETQNYEYEMPRLATSPGNIKLVKVNHGLDIGENQEATYPKPDCPDCGSALRLVVDENDWYCDTCKKFTITSSDILSSVRYGTEEGRKTFWRYFFATFAMIAVATIGLNAIFVQAKDPSAQTAYVVLAFIVVPIIIYILSRKIWDRKHVQTTTSSHRSNTTV